jgi:hypothetical protein
MSKTAKYIVCDVVLLACVQFQTISMAVVRTLYEGNKNICINATTSPTVHKGERLRRVEKITQ